MGTIFVAYGEPGHRNVVLRFAAEQAAGCGHELLVYHVQESGSESPDLVREEAETVVERTAPNVDVAVEFEPREEFSDETNVSEQKRLVDRVVQASESLEYVVMGDVGRGAVEELVHASMTAAVLRTHAVPVLLVPV